MDSEVVAVGGWWRRTTQMPAVPINHSLTVIDSANVVRTRQGKLEGNQSTHTQNFLNPRSSAADKKLSSQWGEPP